MVSLVGARISVVELYVLESLMLKFFRSGVGSTAGKGNIELIAMESPSFGGGSGFSWIPGEDIRT